MLRKLRIEHLAHSFEFNGCPIGHDIPRVQTMGRHCEKGWRRGLQQPVTNRLLARLTGLIGMLRGRKNLTFKLYGSFVEVTERAVRFFARSVKGDYLSFLL